MNESFLGPHMNWLCGAPAGAKTIFPIRPYKSHVVASTAEDGSTVTTTYEVYSDGIKARTDAGSGMPPYRVKVEIFKTIVTSKDGDTYVENLHGEGIWEDHLNPDKIRWVPICHPVDWDPKTGLSNRIR